MAGDKHIDSVEALGDREFNTRLETWQSLLDNLPPNDPEREAMEVEALRNLEQHWPHVGKEAVIFGQIRTGLISDINGSIRYATPGIADDTPGISDGFGVFTFIEEGVPREKIAYVFRATARSPIGVEDSTGIEWVTEAIYALNPKECRILFGSEMGVDLDFHSLTSQLSDELVATMKAPDFLILHANEQQAVIDRRSDQAWRFMRTLQPGLSMVACSAQYGYVLQPTKSDVLSFQEVNLGDEVVNGELVGLEVLETQKLAGRTALRSLADFVNPEAGLCLAVVPSELVASRLGLLAGADLLYIPISGQDIEVIVNEAESNHREEV